jgi:hypothetical protein
MRGKFASALSIAQKTLTVGLLRWAYLWDRAARRVGDSPGASPAFQLLVAINAPVAVVQLLWRRCLSGSRNDALFVFAVGCSGVGSA